MTIKECKERKKKLKQMLENIEVLKLALIRSIAIEDLNIADLRKKERKTCSDCIIDKTDACPRGAGRAVDDDVCEEFLKGETENE